MNDTEKCEANCDRGFLPCPHDDIDETGWCRICDTPADEPNPRMTCETCF